LIEQFTHFLSQSGFVGLQAFAFLDHVGDDFFVSIPGISKRLLLSRSKVWDFFVTTFRRRCSFVLYGKPHIAIVHTGNGVR